MLIEANLQVDSRLSQSGISLASTSVWYLGLPKSLVLRNGRPPEKRRHMRNIVAGCAAAVIVIGLGAPAKANLILDNQSPDLIINASCTNITGCNGGQPPTTLSASAELSNFVWASNGTSVTFQIILANTTPLTTQTTGVDLTAFGFNTAPATSASGGDAQFTVYNDETLPGFNKLQFCGSSGPTCAGGANQGLFPTHSNTFDVTLTGLSGQVDLGTSTIGGPETYDFKMAGSLGSFEFSGTACSAGTPGCGTTSVPEPGSLLVMGSALIGLGVISQRRRRRPEALTAA